MIFLTKFNIEVRKINKISDKNWILG